MTIPAPLYPLRFEPIYQYRLWGGRRLADWLEMPLPGAGPIGEAWLLSDRADHPSRVAAGPLAGHTLTDLMAWWPERILGAHADRFDRFPLLLKFLDVQKMLSVQVHPPDDRADLIPPGETGKTEAWVVLEAGPTSLVYAGLHPGTSNLDLRSLSAETVARHLPSFTPMVGQAVLIEAGTVHAIGDGAVVFEVQENSDVTFRLYDWDHVDPNTGQKRPLQVDQALAAVDLAQGVVRPTLPVREAAAPVWRERLIDAKHFQLWRTRSDTPFMVGETGAPRILVCIEGVGRVEHEGLDFKLDKGAVMLMPAELGPCQFRPERLVTLLEIAIPDPS